MNPPLAALSGPQLDWARKSLELELDDVDEADEDTLNRIVWHATKGYNVAYPKVARAEQDQDDHWMPLALADDVQLAMPALEAGADRPSSRI